MRTIYLIVVYDVAEERVNRVNKFFKLYLNWIQNSVFEGMITKALLSEMIERIKQIIDENYDAVHFYVIKDTKYLTKTTVGIQKGDTSFVV